jgi:hypothetical protein
MEVVVAVAGSLSVSGFMTVALPSGFTIDTTKIDSNAERQVVGSVKANDAGTAYFHGAAVYFSTTQVRFTGNNTGTWNATTPFTWAAADDITCTFRVPIANWSSNVTSAQRAVEEYAWNSSTSTTSDTTSFGNGSSGVVLQAFAPGTTASVLKRVRFQSPIQATDYLVVEGRRSDGNWSPLEQFLAPFSSNDAGTTYYGFTVDRVTGSTTDADVFFYSAVIPGVNWSAPAGAGYRWRVRKVSGGSSVGFPIASTNIVSDGQGLAIPAGYLGEQIRSSFTFANFAATGVWSDAVSISLTPGVWDINAILTATRNGSVGTQFQLAISPNSGNTATGTATGDNRADSPYPTSSSDVTVSIPQFRVVLSSTTTYYLKSRAVYSSGIPQQQGRISAVRVR